MSDNLELDRWVALLTHAELPVLRQTARAIAALRADENTLSAHEVAGAIAHDPIMTVKLLRYLQRHKHQVQTTDIVQVDQALLMLGLNPFFSHVEMKPLVEDMLKSHLVALPPMLRVVHRSNRASEYAKDWAVLLHDLHYEEVRMAALLHDIAEILMWCFSPEQMLRVQAIKQNDRSIRSRDAQQAVFGFSLFDLQRGLAEQWGLPGLLVTLMSDTCSDHSRVRNVALAVNLARHSANGWDDAALPDDYLNIGLLLRMPTEEVVSMLAVDAGTACDLSRPH